MNLCEETKNKVEFNGTDFFFNTDFRCFLKALKVMSDKDILFTHKIDGLFRLLYDFVSDDFEIKKTLVEKYFELFAENKKSDGVEFSFYEDAELIYSAFWQVYKIDLWTAKLTTEQFIAMIKGIPSGTRFADVLELRGIEIPKITKYNRDYVARLRKAKEAVRLTSEKSKNIFNKIGSFIKDFAENG